MNKQYIKRPAKNSEKSYLSSLVVFISKAMLTIMPFHWVVRPGMLKEQRYEVRSNQFEEQEQKEVQEF